MREDEEKGRCMERAGRGGSSGDPADKASQEETEDGDDARNPARGGRLVVWVSIGVAVIVTAGIVRWNFLPPNDRYFWPVSPDDWAAWGTWAGAFGAIGAVFFAAQSIKHTIEAQKGTERELKADREHDRIEREKERALVREEREALTKEADRVALNDAGKLSFTYRWGPPSDDQYLEVQHRWHQEELERHERGIAAEEENDIRQLQFAHVVITNASRDLVFEDMSLWLVEEGLTVTDVALAERDVPPPRQSSDYMEGSPPEWTWRRDYEPVFPPGTNQWALGSIKASRQLMVKLSFATPQRYDDWDPINLWNDEQGYATPRHLILGYRDQAGRHWIRSTRASRNSPQRLLETKTVPEEGEAW